MTALYIHIPFCEQKCFYCSFVVSIGQEHKNNLETVSLDHLTIRKTSLSLYFARIKCEITEIESCRY